MYNAGAQYQTANCVKICHLLRLSLNNNTFVALIHIDCYGHYHQPPAS